MKNISVNGVVFITLLMFGLVQIASLGVAAEQRSPDFEIIKLFEVSIPQERIADVQHWQNLRRGNLRFFDRKHLGYDNAIAVVSQKTIYIFNITGKLLNKTDFFEKSIALGLQQSVLRKGGNATDVNQLRLGKFSKDGYRDTLVFSYYSCAPWFYFYGSLGEYIGSIDEEVCTDSPLFMLKDLNGDGIDEFMHNGAAFFTDDGGTTWQILWENKDLAEKIDPDIIFFYGADLDYKDGFVGYHDHHLVAVDNKGNVIFRYTLGRQYDHKRKKPPFVTGDFSGNGVRDGIAGVDTDNYSIHFINKEGKRVNLAVFPEELRKSTDPFAGNIGAIAVGRFSRSQNTDSIVMGGAYGIAAFSSEGDSLWVYRFPQKKYEGYAWNGWLYNLLVTDLDGDGNAEIVASIMDEIYIISNKGKGLLKIKVDGYLLGGHGSVNPTIDISDINKDGLKEISVFTSSGKLYLFSVKKNIR